jgi:hypothetical protein
MSVRQEDGLGQYVLVGLVRVLSFWHKKAADHRRCASIGAGKPDGGGYPATDRESVSRQQYYSMPFLEHT